MIRIDLNNADALRALDTLDMLSIQEGYRGQFQDGIERARAFVLLRDEPGESEQMVKRWTATREILTERAGVCVEAWSRGRSLLARMVSLVVLTDFVTCYAALAKGIDPTPVAIIDLFKGKVGQ